MILDNSKDFVNRFYIPISKSRHTSRTQIFTGIDVDGICAVQILLRLFGCDDIKYSLVVCRNITEIVENFSKVRETCRDAIFINCGATDDLIALLDPKDTTRFYVIDSRRPIHLMNLYSSTQVRVLGHINVDADIPKSDEIFSVVPDKEGNVRHFYAEYELNVDDDDEDNGQWTSNKLEAIRKKRDWNKKRRKILDQYHKFQSFQGSSAVKLFELAHQLNKDDHELFFLAVIGLCDMYMQHKISRELFLMESVGLQGHVVRLNHANDSEVSQGFRLAYTQDLALRFYRQWSVFDSLCNTPYTATRFRTWEAKGQRILHELLADMGFALNQCKQTYSAMDIAVRNEMADLFRARADKYNIGNINDATFIASYGFNQKVQVCDVALGLFATVTINEDSTTDENFHNALDAVSKFEITQRLPEVLELGKKQLVCMRQILQVAFEEKLFQGMKTFVQICLDHLSPATSKFIGRPDVLVPLAHYLQHAYVYGTKGKKVKQSPFVLVASIFPPNGEVSEYLHCVGLPSVEYLGKMNPMGYMFQKAAVLKGTEIGQDSYDSFVVRIKKNDKETFFGALMEVIATL